MKEHLCLNDVTQGLGDTILAILHIVHNFQRMSEPNVTRMPSQNRLSIGALIAFTALLKKTIKNYFFQNSIHLNKEDLTTERSQSRAIRFFAFPYNANSILTYREDSGNQNTIVYSTVFLANWMLRANSIINDKHCGEMRAMRVTSDK